ncbi:MAG: hypothetical protein PUC65_08140 [Clostridiales bacterium]|nr:hypothetical protein [Clostridiales bacterium]
MTEFEKIKTYYSVFDEQHRLDAAEGRLEYDICKGIILQYLNKSDRILDLGGGAGKYSIELAKQGYDVTRAFYFPQQVNEHNLSEVFETGRFHNNANVAFQEGYYPESKEIERLFSEHNFSQILLRSIRSFGYNKEEKLYELAEKDISLFNKIIELINKTSTNPAIIETCGHALYIGRKCQ